MLLALFALSITPKIAIHALVVSHTDRHPAHAHDGTAQLNDAGFLCAVDNLVVESPFLDYSISIRLGLPPCFPTHQPARLEDRLSSSHILFGLRGPPVTV